MNQRYASRVASYVSATCLVLLTLAFCFSTPAYADGVPTGWTCTGNCGSSGADGVVPLSPLGTSSYQWVSTNLGLLGVGSIPGIGSGGPGTGAPYNGSTLATNTFSATGGSLLNFYFDFTTSDGAGWADYAWAELLDSSNNVVALLFTARTTPGGSSVPGFGMPAPAATLNPSNVTIQPNQTTWSPLGSYSGNCFSTGCGTTGWVDSSFTVASAGTYSLLFGVTNWGDGNFDTGMAIDGVTIGGNPITSTPEPATLLLLGIGALPLMLKRRRQA